MDAIAPTDKEPSRRSWWWIAFLLGVGLLALIIFATLGVVRDDGATILLTLLILLSLGIAGLISLLFPIGVAMLLGRGYAMRARASLLMQVGGAGIIMLLATLSAVWAGATLRMDEEDRVCAWAEQLVPAIEAYHDVNGHYPEALQQVADWSAAPRLVGMGELHYRVEDGHFEFDLWTGWLSGRCWNSDERVWHRYD